MKATGKQKTLREWLAENDYYEEAVFFDADCKERAIWVGDNDPKYSANVLRVVAGNTKYPWLVANIYTDYREE